MFILEHSPRYWLTYTECGGVAGVGAAHMWRNATAHACVSTEKSAYLFEIVSIPGERVRVHTSDLQVHAHVTVCAWGEERGKVGQRFAEAVRMRAVYTGQGAAWGCCRNRRLHQPRQGPMEEYHSCRQTSSASANPYTATRKPSKIPRWTSKQRNASPRSQC